MGDAYYDVVLTRGPGPDSDFVELENERGEGCLIDAPGGWVDRGDGYAVLRIPLDGDARVKKLEDALRPLAEMDCESWGCAERLGWPPGVPVGFGAHECVPANARRALAGKGAEHDPDAGQRGLYARAGKSDHPGPGKKVDSE